MTMRRSFRKVTNEILKVQKPNTLKLGSGVNFKFAWSGV